MSSKPSLGSLVGSLVLGLMGGAAAGVAGLVIVTIAALFDSGEASWQGPAMVVVFAVCVLAGIALPIINHVDESTKYQEGLAAQERLRKEGERSMQLAEIKRASDLQMSYKNELESLNKTALRLFDSAQRSTLTASTWLSKSKEEYDAGVYSFFWEAIENATQSLGSFADCTRQIAATAHRYGEVASLYEGSAPRFSVARSKLASLRSAEAISEEMNQIVRTALSRKDYTDIYEQRRTSSILIAGFTSMEQAIRQMSVHVSSAIGGLSGSMDRLTIISDAQLRQNAQSAQFASMDHRESLREREAQHNELIQKLDERF